MENELKNVEIVEDFKPKIRLIREKDMNKIFPGTTPSTFDRWARDKNMLKKYKIGGAAFYDEKEVIKLIENSIVM